MNSETYISRPLPPTHKPASGRLIALLIGTALAGSFIGMLISAVRDALNLEIGLQWSDLIPSLVWWADNALFSAALLLAMLNLEQQRSGIEGYAPALKPLLLLLILAVAAQQGIAHLSWVLFPQLWSNLYVTDGLLSYIRSEIAIWLLTSASVVPPLLLALYLSRGSARIANPPVLFSRGRVAMTFAILFVFIHYTLTKAVSILSADSDAIEMKLLMPMIGALVLGGVVLWSVYRHLPKEPRLPPSFSRFLITVAGLVLGWLVITALIGFACGLLLYATAGQGVSPLIIVVCLFMLPLLAWLARIAAKFLYAGQEKLPGLANTQETT